MSKDGESQIGMMISLVDSRNYISVDAEIIKQKSKDSHKTYETFKHNVQLSGKLGVFGTTIIIISNIIGGGIVGIPFATLTAGFWIMLVIHLLNVVFGVFSVYLLLEARAISGLASFSELGYYSFGRYSIFILNGIVAVAQFGIPIAYFIIVGSIGSGLLSRIDSIKDTFWSSRQFPILVIAASLFIFVIKREIQELKSASLILFCGIILFIVALSVLLITEGTGHFDFEELSRPKFDLNMIAIIPTVLFVYGFEAAFFPAFQSLKEKTNANGIKATINAFLFSMTMYIIIALLSLLKFGDSWKGDILENVNELTGAIPMIINIIFLIIVMMQVPIKIFVGKEAILIIIDECLRKSYSQKPRKIMDTSSYYLKSDFKSEKKSADKEGKEYLTMNPIIFYGVSIVLYALIVFLSWILTDVTLVFGIVGALTDTIIIFMAPPIFFLMSLKKEEVDWHIIKKILAWAFFFFGFVVMFGWLFAIIYTAIV